MDLCWGTWEHKKESEPRRHELLELAPETRIQSVTEANLKSDFEGIEQEREREPLPLGNGLK